MKTAAVVIIASLLGACLYVNHIAVVLPAVAK